MSRRAFIDTLREVHEATIAEISELRGRVDALEDVLENVKNLQRVYEVEERREQVVLAKENRAKHAAATAAAAPNAPFASIGKAISADPARLEQARQLYEDNYNSIDQITEALGCSWPTVLSLAKRHGWKKRNRDGHSSAKKQTKAEAQVATMPAPPSMRSYPKTKAVSAAPISEKPDESKPMLRVCWKCNQRTTTDPCSHCGKPWRDA